MRKIRQKIKKKSGKALLHQRFERRKAQLAIKPGRAFIGVPYIQRQTVALLAAGIFKNIFIKPFANMLATAGGVHAQIIQIQNPPAGQ
nr:hypothetical protein [Ottowia sp. oral taxon 894]